MGLENWCPDRPDFSTCEDCVAVQFEFIDEQWTEDSF